MYDGYIGEFENQEIVLYMFGVEHKMTAIEMFDVNGFKLIEENTTDDIEEFAIDSNGFIQTDLGAFKTRKMDIAFSNKMNELIQAVNKINKEIQELKEDKQWKKRSN